MSVQPKYGKAGGEAASDRVDGDASNIGGTRLASSSLGSATITHPLARPPSPTAPTAAAASSFAAATRNRTLHSIDLTHLLSSNEASTSSAPRDTSEPHSLRRAREDGEAMPGPSTWQWSLGNAQGQQAGSSPSRQAARSSSGIPAPISAAGAPTTSSRADPLIRSSTARASSSPAAPMQNQNTVPAAVTGSANEAMMVRRNMIRASWNTYGQLGKGKRILLVLQFLLSLSQVVLGIVVACLPDSLGDSLRAPGSLCDPESMYVFLLLHTFRVLFCMPIDLYLGLSPHRTPAARRNRSAEARAQREANRTFGNLALDAKASRLSDLLGLTHIGIWLYGNYAVWTSLECSHRPADSVVLWWSSLTFLSITYIIILEVALLISLVVFFLPIVLAILRAFGLADRFPRAGIHPTTSKIDQELIEKSTQLVYFVPAETEGGEASQQPSDHTPRVEGNANKLGSIDVAPPGTPKVEDPVRKVSPPPTSQPSRSGGVARLFSRRRNRRAKTLVDRTASTDESPVDTAQPGAQPSTFGAQQRWRYPLHPIPAHRATCPICLVDFVAPDQFSGEAKAAASDLGRPTPARVSKKRRGDEGQKRRGVWNWRSSSRPLETTGRQRGNEVPQELDVEASAALTTARTMQMSSPAPVPEHERDRDGEPEEEREEEEENASSQAETEVLRLMPCGHALHRACVDEWLSSVSGRCPVCQRPLVGEQEEAGSGGGGGDGAAAAAPPSAEHGTRDEANGNGHANGPSEATERTTELHTMSTETRAQHALNLVPSSSSPQTQRSTTTPTPTPSARPLVHDAIATNAMELDDRA